MIERLTERAVIQVDGGLQHVVPCTDGDALVVALVPTSGGTDALTVTHVKRGWNAMGDATFPACDAGLDAAARFRDELLALPIAWSTYDPDPRASGCLAEYQEVRRRANIWMQRYWAAMEDGG